MVVYKETGGFYGGATLGGTTIERDDSVNQQAYGPNVELRNILNGTVPAPASTRDLYVLLKFRS
jgi:lipid-binding SYLF domain-containing protein